MIHEINFLVKILINTDIYWYYWFFFSKKFVIFVILIYICMYSSNNVYKIQFFKSSSQLSDDYENLSEYEKERISELKADGFFDYDDNGKYTVYVITTPTEINSYLGILSNNLINYELYDISNGVLKSKIDLEDELSYQINGINSIKWSFFIDDINSWIYKNLDIDMVLDRISEVGMNSLREIEKEFLKEYKA